MPTIAAEQQRIRRLRTVALGLAAFASFGPLLVFSANELDADAAARRVAAGGVIRIASDPNWPPFSFQDEEGNPAGIDRELLGLIEQRLGRVLTHVPVRDWEDAVRRMDAGEIDVLSGVARTPGREQKYNFTESYLTQSMGLITRADAMLPATMDSLAGRTVAVPRGHAITEMLRRERPDWTLVLTNTVDESMRLVARGEADATITDLVTASYLIKLRGLTRLQVAELAPYRFELRLAVRKDRPELAAMLDSAVRSIDEPTLQQVLDRWIRLDYETMVPWATIWRAVGIGAVLLGIVGAGLWLHERRLARELAERRRVEAELRQARDNLAELNREKTGLMNMAAHDMRNPLTGLLLSLEVVNSDNPQERRRTTQEMSMLVKHMIRLINDLLDVEALEDGHRVLRPERVDLVTLVAESIVENHWAAARKRIRLVEPHGERPCVAMLDPRAVRQVVDNLISNAIKFSPSGAQVELVLGRSDGRVRLEVADHGPGIAAEQQRQLFTKYARLNARPTAGESSVGLGLSIAWHLVEAMQGRIWCESELGRGARFIVELPVPPAGSFEPWPGGARGSEQERDERLTASV